MNWRSLLGAFSITTRSLSRYQWALGGLTWLNGWSPTPAHIDCVLTWRCNLACPMCNLRQAPNIENFAAFRSSELGVDDWKQVIDDARRSFYLRPNINLIGGEPSLYAGYLDVAEHAKRQGFRCTYVTNGTLLERDAERIVALGLDAIAVSIDGDEAVHDRIRGVGVFRRAVAGARRIQALKRAGNARAPRLFVATAVNRENYDRLHQSLAVAGELGITSVTYLHLQFPDGDLGTHGIVVERLLEEMATVQAAARRLGIRATFYPHLREADIPVYYGEPAVRLGRRCLSPWMRMSILPDGSVIPCGSYALGNVSEMASLRDLWNGERMRAFRRNLARHGTTEICGRCCRKLY